MLRLCHHVVFSCQFIKLPINNRIDRLQVIRNNLRNIFSINQDQLPGSLNRKYSQNVSKFNKPFTIQIRGFSQKIPTRQYKEQNRSLAMLMTALVVLVLGLSFSAVPIYRIYCQKTGKGGKAKVDETINQRVAQMKPIKERKIRVLFEADKSSRLAWNFNPVQRSVICSPGETVLIFYTAKNQMDHPVNGIATYTILPYEAGKYFNKIQCFCFEEQQLNPNEQVDLPVFFFIDPEFNTDPILYDCEEIVLSYNFFETKEGFKLPLPEPYFPKIGKRMLNQ